MYEIVCYCNCWQLISNTPHLLQFTPRYTELYDGQLKLQRALHNNRTYININKKVCVCGGRDQESSLLILYYGKCICSRKS